MSTAAGSDKNGVVWRLAAMMGILFMPISCWYVTLAVYIQANTGDSGTGMFSPGFLGQAYSTTALGALLTPLLVGTVADKWLAADRMMAWLQIACAGLLYVLAGVETQSTFWLIMLIYALCFSPCIGLSNAVCFRHLKDSERIFPRLRALGTFSWVLGGWLVGYLLPFLMKTDLQATKVPMQAGAVLHIVAAIACFRLPRTPPTGRSHGSTLRSLLGGEAISAVVQSSLLAPAIALMVLAIAMQFYTNFTNLMLFDRGVQGAVGHMAWGQVVEIAVVLLLPLAFSRFGIERTIRIGAFCWIVRYILLAIAGSDGSAVLVWTAILVHGVCYAFPFIAMQVQADRMVDNEHRSAVQGLLTMMTNGVGAFVGAQICAICQIQFLSTGSDGNDWRSVWGLAAIVSAVAFVMFLRSAPKNARPSREPQARTASEATEVASQA